MEDFMEAEKITFAQCIPYVRYVQKFYVAEDAYPSLFCAYDNRIFYVYHGSGMLKFANKSFNISRGDLILWPARIGYQMISNAGDMLILLGANYDFTQKAMHISYPVPPVVHHKFTPDKVLADTVFVDETPLNDIIYLRNMYRLEPDFLEMLQEYDAQKVYYNERLSAMLKSVLCLACRNLTLQGSSSFGPNPTARIEEVLEFIQTNYAADLTNADIGHRFNYHPNYLNKLIKLYTGKSLHQYLLSCRLTRAVDLLSTTNLPISVVADQVGFKDLCHFGKLFHEKIGVPPSTIRDPFAITALHQTP